MSKPILAEHIQRELGVLIGLPLVIARNAGDMKVFHFGETRQSPDGVVGSYALHIQCPWRIYRATSIVTGSHDYYIRADNNNDPSWEPGLNTGHRQAEVFNDLFADLVSFAPSDVRGERLIVEAVHGDSLGGAQVQLTHAFVIEILPCASRDEQWRMFRPSSDVPHFVVGAGDAHYQ